MLSKSLKWFDIGLVANARESLWKSFTSGSLDPDLSLHVQVLHILLVEHERLKRERADLFLPSYQISALNIEICIGEYRGALKRGAGLLRNPDLSKGDVESIVAALCALFELQGKHDVASLFGELFVRILSFSSGIGSRKGFEGKFPATACINALARSDCQPVWIELGKAYLTKNGSAGETGQVISKLLEKRLT